MELKYSVNGRKVKPNTVVNLAGLKEVVVYVMYTDRWSKDGKKRWYVVPESCSTYKAALRGNIDIRLITTPSIKETKVNPSPRRLFKRQVQQKLMGAVAGGYIFRRLSKK